MSADRTAYADNASVAMIFFSNVGGDPPSFRYHAIVLSSAVWRVLALT